jgi:cysteinyl-tRNA synthetase
VNDLLKKFSGSTIRLSLLSSHYRQPLDWSEKILEQSHKNIKKFKRILNKFSHSTLEYSENDPYFNEFLNDLYDDLNTPKALATINRFLDQCKDGYNETNLVPSINKCFEVLGINLDEFCDNEVELNEDEKKTITALIKERNKARENKDFEKADKIRETLKEMSIEIEDSSNGTNWKKID